MPPLDYAEPYDIAAQASSSILGSPASFTLATIADIGTSLWNSLPLTPEVKTADLLEKVDKDALALYNEHPDAVHTASLIGGSLIPGAIGMKLLSRARAGVSAVGYTTNEVGSSLLAQGQGAITGGRQKALLSELEASFKLSGPSTTEYKGLARQIMVANGLQQLADTAVIELAVVGTLNAHPYMEDYKQDFGKNFAISVAAGGVLGALFSIPMSNAAIFKTIGPLELSAKQEVLDSGYRTANYSDMTNTAQFQRSTMNIRSLKGLIEEGNSGSPYRAEIVNSLMLSEGAAREASLERMYPAYAKTSPEVRDVITQFAQREELVGVDRIKIIDLNRVDKNTSKVVSILDETQMQQFGLRTDIPKNMVNPDTGKPVVAFARLSQTGELEVFAAAGARNAARAVDIKDAPIYLKGSKAEKIAFTNIVKDFEEENLLRSATSAEVDLRFLKELTNASKLKPEQRAHILVGPDDLPRQNAVVSLLEKLTPEELAATKVNIRSDYPTYEAIQTFLTKTVGKDYSTKLAAMADNQSIGLWRNVQSEEAKNLLNNWQGGDTSTLRKVFTGMIHGTRIEENDAKLIPAAKEIWEAGAKYRAELRKIADADGNVYLYRSLSRGTSSHAAVEGYSVGSQDYNYGAKLYKVNVDNVIGSITSNAYRGEREILVTSPHNQIVNSLPVETGANTAVHIATSPTTSSVTAESFLGQYTTETERQVKNLISGGASFEEVSARTNTTKEAVQYIASGGKLQEMTEGNVNWRRYSDVAKLDEYLHPRNKMYAVIGNPYKNPTGEAINKLDDKTGRIMHMEQVEQMALNSNSVIAGKVIETLAAPEMKAVINDFHNTLAEVNNLHVGNPQYQSADNALRRMKEGPTVTFLGKQIINNNDAVVRQFSEPMANALIPLKDKPEAVVELSNLLNKMHELDGWRQVRRIPGLDQGVIVQREMGTLANGKQGLVEREVKNVDGSTFTVQQPEVLNFFESTREATAELYKTHNLNRSLTGQAPLNDLGDWIPPVNLVNKAFAFVIDPSGQTKTRMLVANKADELESLISAFKQAHPNKFQVVTKADQDNFNLFKGYNDYEAFTTYANVAYQHKGTASSAIPYTDDRLIQNLMGSYENLFLQSGRKTTEIYLADTMQWLDKMSSFNRRALKEGKEAEYIQDSARTVKNILLGRDQLEQSPTLRKINTITDTLINYAANIVNNVASTVGIDTVGSKAYYDTLNTKLKQVGINQPLLGSFQEYLAASIPQSKDVAHSVISAGNGLMATTMLRLFELAQPLVNVMSLPILTSSALMERLPKTVINAAGDKMTFPLEAMYNGVRGMFNPQMNAIEKRIWEPMGLLDPITRQYQELQATLHQAPLGKTFTERAVDSIQNFQNKALVKDVLSRPADEAERFTQRYAMMTGFQSAKTAYPGISDMGATIMAMNFKDRAVGNYYPAQRPTLFQGSFGAGLGLFQTYFLTFAQNIYRGLEDKNFKMLANQMLAQTGLFGISSWPGFTTLSENIISHFNDKHYDLTSGTFRAVEDQTARMVLYGLPSSLGPAFYTRGDISPRVPSTMTELAVLNGVKQGWSALHNIVTKTTTGIGNGNGTQALFEALSAQSLNRPIARWSELVTGYSVTGQGNTVSPTADVWTPIGVTSRLLATRPLEEQVTRNAIHMNSYYNALDHDARQGVMNNVKTAIRGGHLTDELLGETALNYIRKGGSAKGWQSAINQVLIETPEGARMDLLRKLEPNSPLNSMLRDLY